ncbi:MAG: hypothetical protein K2O04_02840 [Clostridiales bacterium]|nr:hypothetical protein [Clostridiales bacterium]
MELNFGCGVKTTFENSGNILISGTTGSGKTYLLQRLISSMPKSGICIVNPKRNDYAGYTTFADIPEVYDGEIVIIDGFECLLPPHKSNDSAIYDLYNIARRNIRIILATQYMKQSLFDKIDVLFPTKICMHVSDSQHAKQILGKKICVPEYEAIIRIKNSSEIIHIDTRKF